MPLVSILVPVYNGDRFLADALGSALSQTHADIEVLIGDDCSKDRSLAIAEAIAAADPRVHVLPAERNLGASANQVRLHEAANGEFIKPLLQDDRLAPDCVARLLAPLLGDPQLVLSTSKRGLIDERGAALPDAPWTRALSDGDVVLDGHSFGDLMLRSTTNLVGEVTTAIYRAGIVAPEDLWELSGHSFHANADIALWLKFLAHGGAAYTPAELSWFRQHDAQSSRDPRVVIRGALEWTRMPLAARSAGFLADPVHEREALLRAAQVAGAALGAAAVDPDRLAALAAGIDGLRARVALLDAVAA